MMICELIAFKAVCRIFLIFCQLSLISNFIVIEEQFFGTLKSPKLKHLKTSLNKFPHTILKTISAQISCKIFFFFFFEFFLFCLLFLSLQNHWFGPCFFPQKKKKIYTFFQVWSFHFNIILKTCFKNLFRKTVKKRWFTFLNKPFKPYKLPQGNKLFHDIYMFKHSKKHTSVKYIQS